MNEQDVSSLKSDVFYQAGIFLGENGLLAPFGSVIKKGIIKPVGYYNDENEIVDTVKAVDVMREIFSKDIKFNKAEAAAIAYDVAMMIPDGNGNSVKRDAMCLLLSTDGEEWKQEYFPYTLIDDRCVWDSL